MKKTDYEFIFSVIIPVFNRAGELSDLLESLKAQSIEKEKFEIILVDDGSTDGILEAVGETALSGEIKISLFKQNHKGPGAARNFGMQKALGEYLVFIDSDCIAHRDWLKSYENAVNNSSPAAMGGPDSVLPEFTPLQKSIDYSMTSFITTGGIRGHSRQKLSKFYPRSFNMAVRAEVVASIGGMKDLRHGQDIEFSNRIINTGLTVMKVDNALVYHKRRVSFLKFFRQVFNWGVARINLYKIDKKMLQVIHTLPALGTFIVLIILIGIFLKPGIFVPVFIGLVIMLILQAFHGIIKYRDIRVFFYIPLVIPTQLIGYGAGFIYAFIRRILLGGGELTGFEKKYYR